MRRMTYFVMALALVLGFTQCKKEQPTPQTQGVRITLTVDGGSNNSKVIVNPTGHTNPDYATVTFEDGDVIYVGNDGAYCGYLQYSGSQFSGTITPTSEDDYLHFYFMGNKGTTSQPTSVSITDQTSKYPVISYAHSDVMYSSSTNSYSAKLQNYCAIVKFTTNDIPTATALTVKGMQNTVSVDFGKNNAAESKLDINPYTPGQSGDGDIILHAVSNTERWAILLAQDEVENATVTATGYENGTCTVPKIVNNTYHSTGVSVELASKTINLSEVSDDKTIQDGYTVTGTLGADVQISIAADATVTLDGVNITNLGNNCDWAGINCPGNATIILKDGSTNTVCAGRDGGGYSNYPGIWIAPGTKLTIKGGGQLTAYSNNTNPFGAGIGGGYNVACGNIEIQGGDITATGGESAAGIGSGYGASCGAITISGGDITATGGKWAAGIGSGNDESANCGAITISGGTVTATVGEWAAGIGSGYGESVNCGDITITGGTVTATGSSYAAGIGSGRSASCDNITITNGVTKVTATKGNDATNSIGAGYDGSCGTVTIGCTLDGDGNPVGGQTGPVTTSPLVYPTPEQTITWTSSDLDDVRIGLGYPETTKTIKRITATISSGGCWNVDSIDGTVTFSSSTYTTFKNIEITCSEPEDVPSGWSYGDGKLTWTGSSSPVLMTTLGESIGSISKIVFTVQ